MLLKERTGGVSYALYGNTDTAQAGGHVSTPLESSTKSTSALPRRRVDAPGHHLRRHDAAPVRQRRPGLEPRRRPAPIPADTGALRIGGNAIWAEWFSGLIDEVRVYNRALPAAELQADMATPVTCSGPPRPRCCPSPRRACRSAATQGGASPAAKTLDVATPAGAAELDGVGERAVAVVAPASGTNAGTITVTPPLGGLAAGTYTTDVTVTRRGDRLAEDDPGHVHVDPPPPSSPSRPRACVHRRPPAARPGGEDAR